MGGQQEILWVICPLRSDPEWRQGGKEGESGDQSQTVGRRVWLGCLWESSSPVRGVVTSIIHPYTGFHPFGFTFPALSSFLIAKQMSHCPWSLAFSNAHSQPLCRLKHIQVHTLAEKQTTVAWDRNSTCTGICAYLKSISQEWNRVKKKHILMPTRN